MVLIVEVAAWGALPAFLQTEVFRCDIQPNRLVLRCAATLPHCHITVDSWLCGSHLISPREPRTRSTRPEAAKHESSTNTTKTTQHYIFSNNTKLVFRRLRSTFPRRRRVPVHQWEPDLPTGSPSMHADGPVVQDNVEAKYNMISSMSISISLKRISTISNPFTHFDVANKLHGASKWQHVVRTKELSVWPSVQVPQLPPEHENSWLGSHAFPACSIPMSLRLLNLSLKF